MAKSVDAGDLKSLDRKVMPVQVRLRAPFTTRVTAVLVLLPKLPKMSCQSPVNHHSVPTKKLQKIQPLSGGLIFMGDCFCQFLFLPHFLPHPKVRFTKQAARQLFLIGEVLIVAC